MLRPARPRRIVPLLITLLAISALVSGQSQSNPAPAQPAPAQTPVTPAPSPPPMPLFTKLNVLVTGEKDAAVSDLQQIDFQVLEDGVPQTITSFAHEEMPVSYVLVMDNTGSLRGQLNQAIGAGATLVAGNRPDDETAVIRFISSDKIQVMQEFTAQSGRVNSVLSELYVEGGQSAVIDAVYLAAKYVAAHSSGADKRRRALVLVTDGEDRKSSTKLEELLNYLRASDVQVFAIGLVRELDNQSGFTHPGSRDRATKLLDKLTAETGGRVFYPDNVEQLRKAAQTITRDLHTQYVIGYTPTNQTRDGKQRKVQVKLVDKPGAGKRTVIARAVYVGANSAPGNAK